jgi:hypothetical protein
MTGQTLYVDGGMVMGQKHIEGYNADEVVQILLSNHNASSDIKKHDFS